MSTSKALALAGLSTKDRASLMETVVDVVASPGVFSAAHSQAHDEVQGVREAAQRQCWPPALKSD